MGGWEGEGMGQTDLRGSCSEAALESAVTVVGQGEAGWGWAPLRDPPCPRPVPGPLPAAQRPRALHRLQKSEPLGAVPSSLIDSRGELLPGTPQPALRVPSARGCADFPRQEESRAGGEADGRWGFTEPRYL